MMATRPFIPQPRQYRRHKRSSRWRRDRRPHPTMTSLRAALAIIPSLPRPVLDRLTQRCIDRLDEMDGDLDLGPNGDELDGTGGEDDFVSYMLVDNSPGCPLSDPGEDNHDQEYIDEREPEPWPGGGDVPHHSWRVSASA